MTAEGAPKGSRSPPQLLTPRLPALPGPPSSAPTHESGPQEASTLGVWGSRTPANPQVMLRSRDKLLLWNFLLQQLIALASKTAVHKKGPLMKANDS